MSDPSTPSSMISLVGVVEGSVSVIAKKIMKIFFFGVIKWSEDKNNDEITFNHSKNSQGQDKIHRSF